MTSHSSKAQVFSINNLCHRDAKKTSDSQRMGKREVVTEIRALTQPVVAQGVSGAHEAWCRGETTSTFIREDRPPRGPPRFPPPYTSFAGWEGSVRSEKNSVDGVQSQERQMPRETGLRMTLSLRACMPSGERCANDVQSVSAMYQGAPIKLGVTTSCSRCTGNVTSLRCQKFEAGQ